jgi:hypothetical protein
MSTVNLIWDDEAETIIRIEFDNRWNWDDLYAAVTEINEWIEARNYPISIIAYPKGDLYMPPNVFMHLSNLPKFKHERSELAILVGNNGLVKNVFSVVTKVSASARELYNFASSLEEARSQIKEYRSTRKPNTNS